ncbi:MAG: 50S ribosomal protein L9 [Alphaproteobacteria bacterium]|nr:MAG: 50S ribosomal protein L9 [Alphaproteobacteria bacterium]
MEVVLLERVEKLGQMGDVVKVKDGYARNYLLRQGKARRATKENLAIFEVQRAQIEANNLEARKEADAVAAKLEGTTYVVLRQAGEAGQLYGSVSPRDISEILTENGFTVARSQISVSEPIKMLGLHDATVRLHAEVSVKVVMNVARSADEAERQARGEDVIGNRTDEEQEALALAEEVFENEELAHEAEDTLADETPAEAASDEAAEEEAKED